MVAMRAKTLTWWGQTGRLLKQDSTNHKSTLLLLELELAILYKIRMTYF